MTEPQTADSHDASVAVRVEVAVLTLAASGNGSDDSQVQVLVVEGDRDRADRLPGEVLSDADLAATAHQVLMGIGLGEPAHMEQLASFGAPGRQPGGRVISVTYLALVPEPVGVGGCRWTPAGSPGPLAFDHAQIIAAALERIRSKLSYSTIAYGLLPPEFTMSELQDVYEAVLATSLDKRNFRKKVHALGLVAETGRQRRGSHRPAQLYEFPTRDLRLLDGVIATA